MLLMNKNNQAIGLFCLKTICLLFWGGWFLLAFVTNFCDFLCVGALLPSDWSFRSGNYDLLTQALHIYPIANWFQNSLFTCDIFVQGLSATLFFIAAYTFWREHPSMWRWINIAFFTSISLWAVFLLLEEVFMAYQYETVHRGLLLSELVTLMAIHLLPQSNT